MNLSGKSSYLDIDVKNNYTLQLEEVTPLTKLVLCILCDVYYTKLYVNTSNECNREMLNISDNDINKMKVEYDNININLNKKYSSLDKNKADIFYKDIVDNQKNLIISDINLINILEIVINRLNDYIDISESVLLYNTFDFSDNVDNNKILTDSLEILNSRLTKNFFESLPSETRLDIFKEGLLSIMPLLSNYVLTELELCDVIKPLGIVTDNISKDLKYNIYYINIEHPPMLPYGYSVFSYPLIPFRVIMYFDLEKGEVTNIKPDNYLVLSVEVSDFCCNSKYQVDTVKILFNIYKSADCYNNLIDMLNSIDDISDNYIDTINEAINIVNENFMDVGELVIVDRLKLEIDFKDYILFYTNRDIKSFMGYWINIFNYKGV